ncbi:MAG: glucosamine-6-phosphate deaminase [Defluviitaleaceae bacterium]|nr:glucosamine-6-phosphate deaminase [Defluviitaleaceae bacterium]
MLKNLTLHKVTNYEAMSQKAAEIFAEAVNANPTGSFGFATGSTPIGMYKALTQMQKNSQTNLSKITAFNLDEYYPIKANDPQSYAYFMAEHLFTETGITKSHIPNGEAKDPQAECEAYEQKISSTGGIDMQILGIGTNGHIGFNEPAQNLLATTSYVPLAEATIESNSRLFASPDDVPRHALTMGIHSIMMAKRILLLASGASKAEIIRQTIYGPITTQVPASLLQLHQDVTIIVDSDAAKNL